MSRSEINSFGSALWPYQANNDKLLCFVLISYYLLGEYKTEKKKKEETVVDESPVVSGAVFLSWEEQHLPLSLQDRQPSHTRQ